MNYFLLLLSGLIGLTLNWLNFYYRKVLDYRKQKKELKRFLDKLKIVEVYSEEMRITKIFAFKNSENLTPEYFIKRARLRKLMSNINFPPPTLLSLSFLITMS
jgi:hypothetical protein